MSYICYKPAGSCPGCSHYRYDEDYGGMACFAQVDENATKGEKENNYTAHCGIRSNAFEAIRKAVQSDIDAGEPLYILEESKEEFVVVDDTEGMSRAIRYVRHDKITPDWLEEHILMSSMVSWFDHAVDPHSLAEYIFRAVDRHILQTLEYIVIIADADRDWDELFPVLEDRHGNPILDCCDLPDDGMLGVELAEYQTVVINLDEIVRSSKEICAEGFSNLDTEVNLGVITTVLHELFHMAQNDPYASEELFQGLPQDPEAQAEAWARRTFEEHGGYVLAK